MNINKSINFVLHNIQQNIIEQEFDLDAFDNQIRLEQNNNNNIFLQLVMDGLNDPTLIQYEHRTITPNYAMNLIPYDYQAN